MPGPVSCRKPLSADEIDDDAKHEAQDDAGQKHGAVVFAMQMGHGRYPLPTILGDAFPCGKSFGHLQQALCPGTAPGCFAGEFL